MRIEITDKELRINELLFGIRYCSIYLWVHIPLVGILREREKEIRR